MAIDREATLKNAEKFLRVGRLDAAIAEYVRVVDDQPKDWNTANALGDLYLRAGQSKRAVPLYGRVANHFLTEGFYPKAAALFKKILKITPDDEAAQLRLAEISVRQGLMADAKRYYSAVERRRRENGDTAGADEIVVRLGTLDPDDLDARLAAARAAERAGQLLEAAAKYRQLYDELVEQGREDDAAAVLRDSLRCAPGQKSTQLLPLARIELRKGRLDEARAMLLEFIAQGGDACEKVAELAWELVEQQPESAALCVETATDGFVTNGDFANAAALLQRFAMKAPAHVPTLLRLVEVCVDGSLEETMFAAQAQLADAYLANGSAAEARVIAEDLVARAPGDSAHVERLRRALRALNVDDIETVLSEQASLARLEEESALLEELMAVPEASAPQLAAALKETAVASVATSPAPVAADALPAPLAAEENSADRAQPASAEIDLTGLLGEIQGQAPTPVPSPQPARDLEDVFAGLRAEAEGGEEDEATGEHLELARTYLDMGMPQEAISSLEMAARSPRLRFAASSMLVEIHRDEGDLRTAIEWCERAAEVPAPEPEQGRSLLYDLADLLETVGETARALAVFLELSADVPDYRDVRERVTRLSRLETEG